jgi:thiamine-phosphate pyrophosphorylase
MQHAGPNGGPERGDHMTLLPPVELQRALALCAITDDLRDGVEGLVARAVAAVDGGATMVQLRLKHADARVLVEVGRALVGALTVPVIVNDRLDVALGCGAAGAHLGADDLPIAAARPIVPPGFILGASVGDDHEVENGRLADYVGIGPVYGTTSKADAGDAIGVARFVALREATGRPALAIGGVEARHVAELRTAGAAGVAVIRAILGQSDPRAAAAAFVAPDAGA